MKWKNQGHEFDELCKYMKETSKLYFYGCTDAAKSIFKQTEWILRVSDIDDIDIVFVDRDIEKQNAGFCGRQVISPEKLFNELPSKNGLVILCTSEKSIPSIENEFAKKNIQRRIQAYSMYEFYRYLSIFLYSKYNIKYFHAVDIFVHTNCNLNCKDCFIQTFRGVRISADIDKLKRTIDELFEKVDFVGIVFLGIGDGFAGGKPMEFAIEYINNKYSDKFMTIELVTNGTIFPSKSLIDIMKKAKIDIVLDDYRENVELAQTNFEQIGNVLKENGIKMAELCRDYWYQSDFGDFNIDKSDVEMSKRYYLCVNGAKGFPFIGYGNKNKMYSCVMQTINSYLNLFDEQEQDGMDFNNSDFLTLNEFLLGFSSSGYLSACKKCAGMFEGVELNHVPVAVQIEK